MDAGLDLIVQFLCKDEIKNSMNFSDLVELNRGLSFIAKGLCDQIDRVLEEGFGNKDVSTCLTMLNSMGIDGGLKIVTEQLSKFTMPPRSEYFEKMAIDFRVPEGKNGEVLERTTDFLKRSLEILARRLSRRAQNDKIKDAYMTLSAEILTFVEIRTNLTAIIFAARACEQCHKRSDEGGSEIDLYVCAGCFAVRYCNGDSKEDSKRTCQERAWSRHKEVCGKEELIVRKDYD